MQELQNSIVEAFQRKIADGKFDEIIEEKMTKFLSSVVDDSLSSWGDFSKVLKKKLSEDLQLRVSDIDFATYNAGIMQLLQRTIQENYVDLFQQKMMDLVADIFEKPPEKMKLSELIEKFKESCEDDDAHDISFHYESDGDFVRIYFDEEEGKKDHSCDYRLYIYKGELTNIKIKDWSGKISFKDPRPLSKSLYGFDAFLFRFYSWGSTLVLDEDRVDTHIGYGE
jgi:hypothetical protein